MKTLKDYFEESVSIREVVSCDFHRVEVTGSNPVSAIAYFGGIVHQLGHRIFIPKKRGRHSLSLLDVLLTSVRLRIQ